LIGKVHVRHREGAPAIVAISIFVHPTTKVNTSVPEPITGKEYPERFKTVPYKNIPSSRASFVPKYPERCKTVPYKNMPSS
jgi:hypothetical protein